MEKEPFTCNCVSICKYSSDFFSLFVHWQCPAKLLCIRFHHYVCQLQCHMVLELSVIAAVKQGKHITNQIIVKKKPKQNPKIELIYFLYPW